MEKKEKRSSVGKLTLAIFAVIISVHLVLLAVLAGKRSPRTPDADEETVEETPAAAGRDTTETPVITRSENGGVTPAGLWNWYKLEKTAGNGALPPPGSGFLYRRLSGNPRFGEPFNYSRSRHTDFSPKEISPGSAGARAGILVDMDSRTVLWDKNPEKMLPPASMTKMMTLLLCFERMENRRDFSPETTVQVTSEAAAVKEGEIWLDTREKISVDNLLKAAAIKSANDAAVQLACLMEGGSAQFVPLMNRRAREIGMRHTDFINPCGLPGKNSDSRSCAEDMVLLGERLTEYPLLMKYLATQQETIPRQKVSSAAADSTVLTSTNKLINPHYPGVDGMKTGYTRAAGSCLTFSAVRGGRRLMGCVMGFPNAVDRDNFCRRLLDWGYKRIGSMPL